MNTDLVLIATLLSIALLSGLAATDVFNPADITPSGFKQPIGIEVPQ